MGAARATIMLRITLLLAFTSVVTARLSIPELFERFQTLYNRSYTNSSYDLRLAHFTASLRKIGKLGGDNSTASATFTGLVISPSDVKLQPANLSRCIACDRFPELATDDSVDWVSKGAVTPVKNQGQCGSFWSFATTGCVEGAKFISTGTLTSLSEEQLVSCDTTDNGCKGGTPTNAYAYIEKAGGIVSESSYPYTAGSGNAPSCDQSKLTNFAAQVTNFNSLSSESDMKSALFSVGPLAVGINAAPLQHYQKGVLDLPSSECNPQ